MRKIALAALLATGLMAADSGVYVGLDLGKTQYDGTDKYIEDGVNVSESIDDNEFSQTLKVGYYLNANNRAYGFVQNINLDGAKTYSYGVGYDYLIGSSALKPFVGVFAGKNSINPDDDGDTLSGAIYGAQVGVNYAMNGNFSVEAGYRYNRTNIEENFEDGSVEIDAMKNWFVGVNYKF